MEHSIPPTTAHPAAQMNENMNGNGSGPAPMSIDPSQPIQQQTIASLMTQVAPMVLPMVGPMLGPIINQVIQQAQSQASGAQGQAGAAMQNQFGQSNGQQNNWMQMIGPLLANVAQFAQNVQQNSNTQTQTTSPSPESNAAPIAASASSAPVVSPAATAAVAASSSSTSSPSSSLPVSPSVTPIGSSTFAPSLVPVAQPVPRSPQPHAAPSPVPQQAITTQPISSAVTAAPAVAPAASSAATNPLMNMMMNLLQNNNRAQTNIATSTAPSAASMSANNTSSAPAVVGGGSSGIGASMLTSMMPMFASMMGGGGGGGGGTTIGQFLRNVSSDGGPDDDADDGEESVIDEFTHRMMDELTIPDLLAVMQGNFSSLDRTEPTVYEFLMNLMENDDSPTARELIARTIARSALAATLPETVLEQRRSQLRENMDPIALSLPVLTIRVRLFVDAVMDRHNGVIPPPLQPFGAFIQQFGQQALGAWLDIVSQCYQDGITSVEALAKSSLNHRFASVGPELSFILPMVSGTITNAIMVSYQRYRQQQMTQRAEPLSSSSSDSAGAAAAGDGYERWMQYVPDEEKSIWHSVIMSDEAALNAQWTARRERERRENGNADATSSTASERRTLFKPLSYTYLRGSGSSKKQALAESSNASTSSSSSSTAAAPTLNDSLVRTLQTAMDDVASNDTEMKDETDERARRDAYTSGLLSLGNDSAVNVSSEYRTNLSRQLKRQVAHHSDYESGRKYPAIDRLIARQDDQDKDQENKSNE